MSVTLLKTLTFLVSLLPFAKLLADIFGVAGLRLSANPVEDILHRCGWWGLTFILITLAVSPARDLLGMPKLIRLRRMLGLFAFFYVSLHFTTYAWLDQNLDVGAIGEDIVERPYITIGMAAIVMLIPLAVTSTDRMRRRLKKRWQTLHKLVYVIAMLGVWHFYWQVKKDVTEPLIFAAILATLLSWRVWRAQRRRARPAGTQA